MIKVGFGFSDFCGCLNLLLWMVLLCGFVFVFDLLNVWDVGVGIGYVFVVIVILVLNCSWYIMVVVVFGVFLLMVVFVVLFYDDFWWCYFESYVVILFVIIVMSVFGSVNLCKFYVEVKVLVEVV